jgi:Ca2+-binding EF-hand superfamily protein
MRVNCCAVMLVLTLVPAAGGDAAPQAQARNAEAERFRAMDQDRDGVITRSEWRGSTQSFDVHDWNRDGVLSGDEVRPGAQRQRPWPDDPGDTATPDSQLNDWTPERFRDLDHNRDGRIAREEWHFDAELFRRVDSDRNGSLSRREFLGLGGDDDDRDDRFSDLDVNGDGRVARAEWHGGPRVFARLDQNRDGFLSRVEMVGAGEDDGPADLFTSLDVNRDSRVTPDEWHWARAGFDRRDGNRDGSLSRDELAASAQPVPAAQRSPAYRAGYDRGVLDGRKAGREDRQRNQWDLDGQRELEQADAGYTTGVGQRSEYQAGYREGFTRAYAEGYGPRR